MGRLVKNPDIRYTNGENQMCIARFTLAVNRKFKKKGEQSADFISCIAFGKRGEFVEKYFQQGTKIVVCGKIQTGSYTNRDGVKVYTTDVIVDEMDFAESKSSTESYEQKQGKPMQSAPIYNEPSAENQPPVENNDWMDIPDGIEEQLPFV